MMTLNTSKVTRLAKLKVINCCQTRYSTGDRVKAVDKRARLLQGEYRKKAKDVDRLYGGTREQKMRKERLIQWESRVRGRNIVRRGEFKLE